MFFQIVMEKYNTMTKIKLVFLYINKFYREEWACGAANTHNLTVTSKGKQRRQLIVDAGGKWQAMSSVSALWVWDINVRSDHSRVVES